MYRKRSVALASVVFVAFLGDSMGEESVGAARRLEQAPDGERARVLHAIVIEGDIESTRRARDEVQDAGLRAALARAVRWQLARRIAPRLAEGQKSQLVYAGQYAELSREGPEVLGALLALMADAASEPETRLGASRALADMVDPQLSRPGGDPLRDAERPALLAELRRLYHDPLFPALLANQVGMLLAILGDTQAVDSELARLERLSLSTDEFESTRSYLLLADLSYRIRDYAKAVKSYEHVLVFYERVLDNQKRRQAPLEVLREIAKELALQYYNAACSASLGKEIDKAKRYLRRAVALQATHYENLEKDGDLENLRRDPEYPTWRRSIEPGPRS